MNAVATKDHLLDLLNEEDDGKRLDHIQQIVVALSLTKGLWAELHYAYKAVEILQRCAVELGCMGMQTAHWKSKKNLEDQRDAANKLADEYHRIQQDYVMGNTH
jgi:hypothetical protein